mgnify:CR=1 FL=1
MRVSLLSCVVVFFFLLCCVFSFFFFQAEDGIRDLVRSRGLGDVYKRQPSERARFVLGEIIATLEWHFDDDVQDENDEKLSQAHAEHDDHLCLLYTSDAADERSSVDLGGRRIIQKKN